MTITFCGSFNSWTHSWSDRAFKTPKSLFKIFLLITKQQVTFCSSWVIQTIKCYLVWVHLTAIWHLYVIYSLASFLNIKIIRKTQLDRSHIRKNTFKVNAVKLWVQQRKKRPIKMKHKTEKRGKHIYSEISSVCVPKDTSVKGRDLLMAAINPAVRDKTGHDAAATVVTSTTNGKQVINYWIP